MMVTLSDATGQFIASCFEDGAAEALENAAREGGCGLLTVELDRRPGEETPRISIKSIKSFDNLASTTRFALEITVADRDAIGALAALIGPLRGARGKVTLKVPLADADTAVVILGRDFAIDAELAEQIEGLPGVTAVEFDIEETRLRSVG
jgi:DNA polymerase-3 subunit alpha